MNNNYLTKKKSNYPVKILVSLVIILLSSVCSLNAQDCSPNAGPDIVICAGDTLTLSGSVSSPPSSPATGSEWIQTGGPSVIIDSPNSLTTTVTGYVGGQTYTFVLVGNCAIGGDNQDEMQVIVQPITEAVISNGNIESCPDAGTIVLNGSAPQFGETVLWQVLAPNDAGVSINFDDQSTTSIVLPEGSCGTSTIRYTIINEDALGPNLDCISVAEIEITNFGGVQNVNAGPDQPLDQCYTATRLANLSGSFGGCGLGGQSGIWEFVSGPTTPSFGNANNANTSVAPLVAGTYEFRWSVSGPCVTGSDTVSIIVPDPTQDITMASAPNNNIVFCDNTVGETTLVGVEPTFTGETVLWEYNGSDPNVVIDQPNNSTTLVTGLDSSNDPYDFTYTILNPNTVSGSMPACENSTTVRVRYRGPTPTIIANMGNDIIGGCNVFEIPIPIQTTDGTRSQYSIVSGPIDNLNVPAEVTYPTPYRGFGGGNFAGGIFSLDFLDHFGLSSIAELPAGTYTVAFRRDTTGDLLTSCSSGTSTINITITRSATTPAAGGDVVLDCNYNDVTGANLSGNPITVGTSVWSQIDGPAITTIDDPFAQSINITGITVPGQYTFRYNVTGGPSVGCQPNPDDVTITLNSTVIDTPIINTAPQTVCPNTNFQLSANVPSAGQQGTWTVSPTGPTFTDADGNPNPNDPNAIVSGMSLDNQLYTFTWTISLINSVGATCPPPESTTVDITTSAAQGPQNVSAGTDICQLASNLTANLFGSAPDTLAGETGEWTSNLAGVTFAPSANDNNATATFPAVGSYILTWTVTSAGCQPVSDIVEITIADEPTSSAGPDQSGCQTTFTMDASDPLPSGNTGQWVLNTGPGGFTFVDDTDPNSDVTFTFSGTYVFDWVVTRGSGNCPNGTATDSVTINVGIPPTIATVGVNDINVCNATSTPLDGNDFDANTEIGYWTVLSGAPNTPIFSDVNDPDTTVSGLTTGTYTFRWNIIGSPLCPSTFADVEVEVAVPAGAGSDQQLCQATSVLLEGTTGSTGTWTQISSTGTNSTITTTGANTANATITPGTEYVFQYEPNDITFNTNTGSGPASCDPGVDTVTVGTIAQPPPPDAGPDQMKCLDDPVVNQVTLAGSDPSLIAGVPAVTGEWEIVFPIGGNGATLANDTQFDTTMNIVNPGLYILEWTYTKGACLTFTDVVRIEAFEPPSDAIAGPAQPNACQFDAQLNATPPTVGIGTWSFANPADDPSGGQIVIDSPNSPTTTLSNIPDNINTPYTLTWTVSNGGPFPLTPSSACDPKIDTVEITFPAPRPSVADAGPDQDTCMDQVAMDAASITSGTGTWSLVSGPNTPSILSPNFEDTVITNLIDGTYVFQWSVTSGGCTLTDEVQVIVNEQPVAVNAGPDQSVSIADTIMMNADPATGGSIGTWSQISGPSTANFIDENSNTTQVTGLTVGTYEFQWSISNGVCNGIFDRVIIEVSALADLELSKSVTPSLVNAGDIVTFELSVFNNNANPANMDATGVAVEDFIPNGYTIVPGTVSNSGVYNIGNNSITWSNLSITSGNSITLTYNVTVNETGPYINSAQIIASDQVDEDSNPATDSTVDDFGDGIADDDEATASVTIQSADISLAKTVTPTTANVGDSVVFTITVTNGGTNDATNVQLEDQLPLGYTYQSDNSGGNYDEISGIWNVGTLTASGVTSQATLEITAIVNTPTGTVGEYNNIAEIINSDQSDPDSTPNNDDGDQSEDD
ncbi:DUF11 domain-containing protein, partial [Kordia jejudonensis]